jgi:hypothetical protein
MGAGQASAFPTAASVSPAPLAIAPHLPVIRAMNNRGDGSFFDRGQFHYDEPSDTFTCPGKQTLTRKQVSRKDCAVMYTASPQVCGACALKTHCTNSS